MSAGRKDDKGKRRWSLVPWSALGHVVDVLMFGAAKYADNNWQSVEDPIERYSNALERHMIDWRLGKRIDEESGRPVLAHVVCNGLFLLAFEVGFDPELGSRNQP